MPMKLQNAFPPIMMKSAVDTVFQLMLYENRMVFMLQNSMIENKLNIIQFLIVGGVKLAAIHSRMVTVHEKDCDDT